MASSVLTYFAPAARIAPEQLVPLATRLRDMALMRHLLNAIPIPFVILNPHRQIVLANDALLEMVGAQCETDLIGVRPGEALNCHHAYRMAAGCGTSAFCRTCGAAQAILSALHGDGDTQECRITQEDGTALDLRVTATPLLLEDEPHTIFTVMDISGEKRRRILERTFFHDVLNTAGIVALIAQSLALLPPEQIVARSRDLTNATMRMVQEIVAHREITAAESSELDPVPVEIDVASFLAQIAREYSDHPDAEGRELVVGESPQAVTLVSDPALLGRVLGNMVKNALEATDPGGRVTLSGTAQDGSVTFSVHNPAVMPPDVQLQVFQRSFSTKGAGRGLGTYSMKLLSERYLSGCVKFESGEECGGTTFSATYPLDWRG